MLYTVLSLVRKINYKTLLVFLLYLQYIYYICLMEISQSIFGLAKNNNGFFKSEKQRDFLTSKIEVNEGLIGHATSGYNSCPIFAYSDNKGIIKIIKSSKKGDIIMFERKEKGILTSLEIKEIKSLRRKYKSLEKNLNERIESFKTGKYNGTMDVNTYTDDMIERYSKFNMQKEAQLKSIKNIIKELENNGKD